MADPTFWAVLNTTPVDDQGNAIVTDSMIEGLLSIEGIQKGIELVRSDLLGAGATYSELHAYGVQITESAAKAIEDNDLETAEIELQMLKEIRQQLNLLHIIAVLSQI